MSKDMSPDKQKRSYLTKLIDWKQPEVKLAFVVSILLAIFLWIIQLHLNLLLYSEIIKSLLQCILGGIISLIGVAVAGVAIVIVLFSVDHLKIIEKLSPGAFETLLKDFKWLALLSAFETVAFIVTIFLLQSPYPVAPIPIFYAFSFALFYGTYYLLFYGFALIGNCIKLSKIRFTLDDILVMSKNIPTLSTEIQLDFLVLKLFNGDKSQAKQFYLELIDIIQNSSMDNKEEVLKYVSERYSSVKKEQKME